MGFRIPLQCSTVWLFEEAPVIGRGLWAVGGGGTGLKSSKYTSFLGALRGDAPQALGSLLDPAEGLKPDPSEHRP